jgi:2-methylcitrate dehydratase PrpD
VLSSAPHLEDTTRDLGERWEILNDTYKPYPCGIVIHPVIDACLALRTGNAFRPEDIEAVVLYVHPLVLELTGKTEPTTELESKFSVFHAAAITLRNGVSSVHDFSDEAARDAGVIALRRKIKAEVTAGIREDEARITVRRIRFASCAECLGQPGAPHGGCRSGTQIP